MDRYAYIELRLQQDRGWVYQKAADATSFIRIGTNEAELWKTINKLASEDWQLVQVYSGKNKQLNSYIGYLLESASFKQ